MAAKEKTEEKPQADPVDAGIAAWVDKHLRNSAFSQDTAAWNHLQGVLPLLGPMIKGEIE